MFTRLLVPLDGSRLAEAALPAAAYLARMFGARVTLLHIIERGAPPRIQSERPLANALEAHAYLAEVSGRAFLQKIPVARRVLTCEAGEVARTMARQAREAATDLCVICTHGHGGMRTWMVGSIAQQFAVLSPAPVLLIHPDGAAATLAFALRHLLMPVDGDGDHEACLPIATRLAEACGASLHMMNVEHGAALSAQWVRQPATCEASQAKGNGSAGRDAVQLLEAELLFKAEARHADPAKAIVRAAREVKADVVVMGVHKADVDAFGSASLAPQVASRTPLPLLLVPMR